MLKRTPIKRRGVQANAWQLYRDGKAETDRDDEGLLYCEDYKIGLDRCGIGRPELDLHHIVGRAEDPKLYYDEDNLVWLDRHCHRKAHGDSL